MDIRQMFDSTDNGGLSFVESWYLKAVAAEILLKQYDLIREGKTIDYIHEILAGPSDEVVHVEWREWKKTGFFSKERGTGHASFPVGEFNQVLTRIYNGRSGLYRDQILHMKQRVSKYM